MWFDMKKQDNMAEEINSIKWHENCYNNWKQTLDKYEEDTLKRLEEIKRDRKRLDFYSFQISEAKIHNKVSFDSDKFRVKRLIK